jgi:phytanoyl-CoA hydroxylase
MKMATFGSKMFFPSSNIYDFRHTYFTHMDPTGLLKEDTIPRDSIFNPALNPSKHQDISAAMVGGVFFCRDGL